jgi:NifU-like protein involved in Fe-S cluster formation
MSKEMTKEELQEIRKHFEIANNQVRKQVEERNIIKGKLQAYQEIIEFPNMIKNHFSGWKRLKKKLTKKQKKNI